MQTSTAVAILRLLVGRARVGDEDVAHAYALARTRRTADSGRARRPDGFPAPEAAVLSLGGQEAHPLSGAIPMSASLLPSLAAVTTAQDRTC
jgi:hypothetical protein